MGNNMSDIFEKDIDEENLAALEDSDISEESLEGVVFDEPLFYLKLAYSCESIYATNDKNIKIETNDYVIVPTRYGKDMAKVLGLSEKPIGIKQSDVVAIERKATEEDLAKAEENKQKEIG